MLVIPRTHPLVLEAQSAAMALEQAAITFEALGAAESARYCKRRARALEMASRPQVHAVPIMGKCPQETV